MYKKTIKYSDFDGNEREEDFYFNLTEAELTEMQFSELGGLKKVLEKIIQTKDLPKMVDIMKTIIQKSYGVKTLDGKHFKKSEEIFNDFADTQAYSELYMELATDDVAAANFVKGILPTDIAAKAESEIKETEKAAEIISMN